MGSLGFWAENLVAPILRRPWAERALEHVPWLSFVAFYTVFANIPYWIAAYEFKFSRLGWFCVQYVTVGLIALFVPRFLAAVLLLALIFADLLCGICESYSLYIRACLDNFRALKALSTAHIFVAILVLLIALLTAAVAAFLPVKSLSKNQRRLAAAFLVVFAVSILGNDILSFRAEIGYMPNPLSARRFADSLNSRGSHRLRLARTPIIRLVRLQRIESTLRAQQEQGKGSLSPVPSASAAAIRAAGIFSGEGNRELPNLVLVMVESWGLAQDAPLRDALVQPYLQQNVLARYEVLQGSVPFYGATVAGEARELCGNSIGYYLVSAPASDLKGCLPSRLAALGYSRIAVHGMSRYMFNRTTWYRTIGFQETWFHDELSRQGLHDCIGAFVGTCDADIAAWIGRRLDGDNQRPYFMHWMTLNSHLPVPVPAHLSDGAPCSAALSVGPNTPLCSWYQLVANVHRSVAQMAMGNLARPTVFVIVGDHAPPFGNPERRGRFSQTDVPYVILVPHSGLNVSKALLANNPASSAPHLAPSSASPPRQTP